MCVCIYIYIYIYIYILAEKQLHMVQNILLGVSEVIFAICLICLMKLKACFFMVLFSVQCTCRGLVINPSWAKCSDMNDV